MADSTDEELRDTCERIANRLRNLAFGQYYDTETGKMVGSIPDDCDDEGRYQDLYTYVLEDNLGVKIVTDLDGNTLYGAEICVAWGGPNIYINTRNAYVEDYWGSTEVKIPFSYDARDQINDYIDELRGCY